jgi:hypothetical protein
MEITNWDAEELEREWDGGVTTQECDNCREMSSS